MSRRTAACWLRWRGAGAAETDDVRYEVGNRPYGIGDEVYVLIRPIPAHRWSHVLPSKAPPLRAVLALLEAGTMLGGIRADTLHRHKPVPGPHGHLTPLLTQRRWRNALQDRRLTEFQLPDQQHRLNP